MQAIRLRPSSRRRHTASYAPSRSSVSTAATCASKGCRQQRTMGISAAYRFSVSPSITVVSASTPSASFSRAIS